VNNLLAMFYIPSELPLWCLALLFINEGFRPCNGPPNVFYYANVPPLALPPTPPIRATDES